MTAHRDGEGEGEGVGRGGRRGGGGKGKGREEVREEGREEVSSFYSAARARCSRGRIGSTRTFGRDRSVQHERVRKAIVVIADRRDALDDEACVPRRRGVLAVRVTLDRVSGILLVQADRAAVRRRDLVGCRGGREARRRVSSAAPAAARPAPQTHIKHCEMHDKQRRPCRRPRERKGRARRTTWRGVRARRSTLRESWTHSGRSS